MGLYFSSPKPYNRIKEIKDFNIEKGIVWEDKINIEEINKSNVKLSNRSSGFMILFILGATLQLIWMLCPSCL
jgi:hypothetical protein